MEAGLGSQIVTTFTGAFGSFATNVAKTIVDAFTTIATNSEGGISNLAIWGLTFGAIGFGTWIVKRFTHKVG